jgi:serralysin
MATKPVWSLDDIYTNFFRSDDEWSASTTSLTFSFPTTTPSGYSKLSGEGKGFSAFGLEQRSWAAAAIELWEDVVDIDFINLGSGGGGDIRFMNTDNGGPGTAHAKGGSKFGDIWVHSDKVGNFDLGYGKKAVDTLIHEIGHALGLQHPGNYNASDDETPTYNSDALYYQDSDQYTIMSYFGPWNTGAVHQSYAQTPLLHDVYAIQQRYGANMSTRLGSTVYGYNSNTDNPVYDFTVNTEPVLCIWDAGGTDELNLSAGGVNQSIDLRPGHFTSALGGTKNISIAYNCWIENAFAGSGNDRVIGNEKANTLRGGAGHDTVDGLDGNDQLIGADGNDDLTGGAGNDHLFGGGGRDDLFGGIGKDTLEGGDGDDRLYGWSGDDVLRGGAGDDYLSGNTGLDQFYGDAGLDVVSYLYSNLSWVVDLAPNGSPAFAQSSTGTEILFFIEGVEMGGGNDTIRGSNEDNILEGGGGNDRIYGYLGDDTLDGGSGNDLIYRRDGSNLIDGGAGDDTINYGGTSFGIKLRLEYPFSGQVVVDRPGTDNDQVDRVISVEHAIGTGHDDTIRGGILDNIIDGSTGDDELRGWSGNDSLFGGYGDDLLEGDTGNDTLHGGIGTDRVTYINRTAAVAVDLAISGGQSVAGAGTDTLISIEELEGTDYSDTLKGNSASNYLLGRLGNDTMQGRGGNDRFDAHEGHDVVEGGSGNDTIYSGAGNDVLDGSSGDDWLYGDEGNDILTGGSGNDRLYGYAGADTVNYAGASGFVRVDLDVAGAQNVGNTEGFDTITEVENAVGSNWGDTLKGTNGSNKLYGLGGNDKLEGRGGNDIIDGGMGSDTASFASSSVGVTVDLSNSLPQNTQAGIDSFISIESLEGSAFNDILTGDVQSNYLVGMNGDDWLVGGEGNDWLGGGAGNDILFGGAGDDIISGSAGNDTVSYFFAPTGVTVTLTTNTQQNTGGHGIDRIYFMEGLFGSTFADDLEGSLGANAIAGFGGNDTITGLAGKDTLTGGAGADTFDFDATSHSGDSAVTADIINDFVQALDLIDLSGIDAKPGTAGDDAFIFRGTSGFNGIGRVRYEQNAAEDYTLVLINTEQGGGAEMAIRLKGLLTLEETDFLL